MNSAGQQYEFVCAVVSFIVYVWSDNCMYVSALIWCLSVWMRNTIHS